MAKLDRIGVSDGKVILARKKFKQYFIHHIFISPVVAVMANLLSQHESVARFIGESLSIHDLMHGQVRAIIYFAIGYICVMPVYVLKFNSCAGRLDLPILGFGDKVLVSVLGIILPLCTFFLPFILVLIDVEQVHRVGIVQHALRGWWLIVFGGVILYGVALMMWILCFRVVGLWKVG